MKKLLYILLLPLMAMACSKDDDPIYTPGSTEEEQKKIDTVYDGLDEMAKDNGYDSIPDLLERNDWRTSVDKKFLIRQVTDTFYEGAYSAGTVWVFQFDPYPFNTNYILTRDKMGDHVQMLFEAFPNQFIIDSGPDFDIIKPTRYQDSTLSFELIREFYTDSLTLTVEYRTLQTEAKL